MSHFREVCEHGTIVTQCRCMGPKTDRIVPCPIHCRKRDDRKNLSTHQPSTPPLDVEPSE